MAELIQEHSARYLTEDGATYAVQTWGEARADGTWEGWLEFHPLAGSGPEPLRTGRETTQPNRDALAYWASGLEPIYFEGAFARTS